MWAGNSKFCGAYVLPPCFFQDSFPVSLLLTGSERVLSILTTRKLGFYTLFEEMTAEGWLPLPTSSFSRN